MNKITKYLVIVFVILLLIFVPERMIFQDHSYCIFKNMTGIQCPLCGMTRAIYLILRLEFISAFVFNPLAFMLPFLLLVEIIHDTRRSPLVARIRKIAWIAAIVGILALFALRLFDFFANR